MLYRLGKIFLTMLCKVFGRLVVIGREHVPATGGAVLAANHTSYADPPLVGVASPRPIWYMARAELFKVPILGGVIGRVHAFAVKRNTADRQALRRAHELLTGGEIVTIFPEGTRSTNGILQPPEMGMAMIALRAGVPIIPTALINADRLLPRHGVFLHFTRVKVVFGEPLTFPHLAGRTSDRAALVEISHTVMRRLAALLREHGAADRVPPGYLDATTDGSPHGT
ncbi:MAG: lysophospholipid acyltransferase family protein [Armatimonadota bacterium]